MMGLDSPIVLLGRGGSGTRLLSELAIDLGVFLGNNVNVSGDSIEWVETLYAFVIDNLSHPDAMPANTMSEWRHRLRTLAEGVLEKGHRQAGAPWGWKLPETILALDPVLFAFPAARFVHLVRHPVTSSLRRTHMTSRLDNGIGQAVLPAAYRAHGFDARQMDGHEAFMHNALTWQFQVNYALQRLQRAEGRVLQVRYEDLCLHPNETRALIAKFLELETPPSDASVVVDWARTAKFDRHDPRVQTVWSICGGTATTLGYDLSDVLN